MTAPSKNPRHRHAVLTCVPYSPSNHRPTSKAAQGWCSWTEHCVDDVGFSVTVHRPESGRAETYGVCAVHHLRLHQYFVPVVPDPVAEVTHLLHTLADGFASGCRSRSTHELDPGRIGRLAVGRRGVETDEAAAFLESFRRGLIDLRPDGSFSATSCRMSPPDLHLIGRSSDHTALHTEYLIHIGALAELLDAGYDIRTLAFEQGEWDVLGYDQGDVCLAVEAKARAARPDADSLEGLRDSLFALCEDPSRRVPDNHRRKWAALQGFAAAGPVEVLLIASGARWWFRADLDASGRLQIQLL